MLYRPRQINDTLTQYRHYLNLHDCGVCLAPRLDIPKQGADLGWGNVRQPDIVQGRADRPVRIALVVGAAVLAHGDDFGGHEHTLPILPQGQNFSRFGPGFSILLPLFSPAEHLSGVALSLELSGNSGQFTLDGFFAPPLWGIPAAGQAGFAPARLTEIS